MKVATIAHAGSELTGRSQRSARAPVGYPALVRRVRALVESAVPSNAVVAVVSKGDPDLVAFSGRKGMHFPRTSSGEYAGHHPADGNDVVTRLQAAHAAGATHLVLPDTSAWWLEHYVGLREYLDRDTSAVVHEDGVGTVYAFKELPSVTLAPAVLEGRDSLAAGQLIELLANLLPSACTLVVAATLSQPPPQVGGRVVWPLLVDGIPSTPLTRTLEDMRSRGAEFMVVPAALEVVLQRHTALQRRLARSCPRLIHQRHVCTVYDLRGGWM